MAGCGSRWAVGAAAGNAARSVGLPIPAYALRGVLVAINDNGVAVSVIALTFYGCLPIMRNAIVGLRGVDPSLVEDGIIGEAEFRELTFVNPARLHAGMNPDFFAGTVCEDAVATVMANWRSRSSG